MHATLITRRSAVMSSGEGALHGYCCGTSVVHANCLRLLKWRPFSGAGSVMSTKKA